MTFDNELAHCHGIDALKPIIEAIPYAQFLGFTLMRDGTDVIGRMAFSEDLIGNAAVDALHGGTIGAMMEFTAICKLLTLSETAQVPKTINITVEYLRGGRRMDTFARATVTRHGRRVANVRVIAYQDDVQRPIAAANAHFLLAGDSRQESSL
jgi:uncharacterized protein (TIGR00369 family)